MTEDSNVIDFLKFKAQARKLEEMASMPDLSKLGTAELGTIVQVLSKVVLEQGNLMNTMMAELGGLYESQQQMQEQFMYVSTQAYCAIQMLKDKGVCSAEEFHELWMNTVQEKILKPQGQQPEESKSVDLIHDDEEEPVSPE